MEPGDGGTTRDLIGYIKDGRYLAASQLLKFGYKVNDDYVDSEVKSCPCHIHFYALQSLLYNIM